MADFVPKGYYALEKAVLLIARELNERLWDHAQMTLSEVNAYEKLGEATHYKDLRQTLEDIEPTFEAAKPESRPIIQSRSALRRIRKANSSSGKH